MGVEWSETNLRSNGGTEAMMRGLEARLDPDLAGEVQIIASRVHMPLDPTKIRVLWCHDLEDDPETNHLANEGWRRFHKIVFVSNHQMQRYIKKYNIPWSRCTVLLNAIEPIPFKPKTLENGVRLVYTSTPHRGLNVLLASFEELAKRHDDVSLDVFSSFGLYGWEDRDKDFEALFQACRDHPKINYHGAQPNEVIRETLQDCHIFAYPSTWVETSCLCLMEAMSADLVCVHSNLGALYETAANWTIMYPFNEDLQSHAATFLNALEIARDAVLRRSSNEPSSQKMYSDLFYNWDSRGPQWNALLRSLLDQDRSIPDVGDKFVYRVGV